MSDQNQTQETAENPVPTNGSDPKVNKELAELLRLTAEARSVRRIRTTRAIVPDQPSKYRMDDGTVFLLRALKHSERRAIESDMLDLRDIRDLESADKPTIERLFDTIETLAKARIIGWENFLDANGDPVSFEKSSDGPFPLTDASLEMIDLGLLRQIGTDIIQGSVPDVETVGK